MRNLKAAVDNHNTESVSEYREAIELVSCQSDNAAIRATAHRALNYMLPATPSEPAPILAFVSGAAALLDAIARRIAEPDEVLPIAAAGAD